MRRLIAMVVLVGCWGCSELADVSGVWEMEEESLPQTVTAWEPPFSGRLKLAVDQFGWDVSGVLLFFSDDLYYELAHCGYVVNGKVVGSDRFLFSVQEGEEVILKGELAALSEAGGDYLVGRLLGSDGKVVGQVRLVRVGDQGKLRAEGWDEGCPESAAPDEGGR